MLAEVYEDAHEIIKAEPIGAAAMHALISAETDIQVATAKKYPRSIENAIKRALSMATIDEETAESCMYALPRGGKTIEGPSIRLAEIFASTWGNLRVEARIVEQNDKWIVARGVCWDLETNNAIALTVQRRITNKRGEKFDDDMIAVTSNAASAIARRNAVFATVPRAYVNKIYAECKRVAVGNAETLTSKRDKLFASFAKIGVHPPMIFAKLGVAGEADITLQHLATLIGLAGAIKNGEATIEDAFAPEPTAVDDGKQTSAAKSTADKAKEKMKAATGRTEQSPVPEFAFTTGEMNDIASRLAKIEGAPSAQEFVASCKGLTEDQVWARLSEMEGQGAML